MGKQSQAQKEKLWTGPYLLLIAMGTMTSTCFYMVNPTITKYAVGLGASVAAAGVISGLFSITALVARPFSGLVADRVNRKRLLIFSTCVMGVAALGYSVSHTVPLLIAFRILHGVAFAFSGTVNVTMIASLVPRSRLGEGVGYYGLVNIFATAIGPSLGLSLGDAFGFGLSYVISGIMLFAAAGFALLIPLSQPPAPRGAARKGIRLDDLVSLKVLPLALLGGLFSMSNGIIGSYVALLGDVRGIANIGLYFTVNAVVLLVVRPLAGKLSDRKNGLLLVFPAMLLDGAALLLLGRAGALWMVSLAAVLKAMGQGSGQPTLQAASLKLLPPEKSGVASSTFYIGGDVGQGLGPMLAGAMVGACGADSAGYGFMFTCASLIFAAGLLGFALYRLKQKNSTPPAVQAEEG